MEEGTRIIHLGKKNSLKDVEVMGSNPISFEKAFGEFKSNAAGGVTNPSASATLTSAITNMGGNTASNTNVLKGKIDNLVAQVKVLEAKLTTNPSNSQAIVTQISSLGSQIATLTNQLNKILGKDSSFNITPANSKIQSPVDPLAAQKKAALQTSIVLLNKAKDILKRAKSLKKSTPTSEVTSIKKDLASHKYLLANHLSNISKLGIKSGFDGYSNAAGDSTSNQYGTTVENADGTYTTTPSDGSASYSSNADGSPLSDSSSTPNTIQDANGNTTFADYNSDINKSTATIADENTVTSVTNQIQQLQDANTLLGQNNFDLGKNPGVQLPWWAGGGMSNDHKARIAANNITIAANNGTITALNSQLADDINKLAGDIAQDYTNWKTNQDIGDLQNQINTLNDDVQAAQDSANTAETDAQTAQTLANSLQAAAAATPAATTTPAIDPTTGLPVTTTPTATTTPTVTPGIDPNTGLPITTTPTAQAPIQSVDTLTGLPTADANAIESGSLESTNQQYPASYGQQPLTYGQAPAQPIYVNQGGGSQDQGMGDGSDNYDYDNEDFDTSDINPDDSSFDGTGKYMPELPYAPEDFSGFTEEQLNKTFKSEEGIEVPITIKVSQLIAEIGIVKSALLKAMWELKWATTENQVSEEGTIPQLRAKVSALKEKFNYLTNILETYKRSRTAKGTPDANRLLEVTEAQKNVLAIANANRAAREAKQAKINSGKASSSQVAPIAAEIPVGGDLVKTTVVNVVSETAPTGNNGSSTNRVVELYSNADGSGDKPNSSINWKVVSLTAVGALVLVFAYNKLKK